MAKIRGRRRNYECYKLMYCKIKNSEDYAVCGIEINRSANEYDVEIPSEFHDKPVVRIETNAFKGKTEITSVIIPDSVTSVGKRAFSGCKNLNNVTIGANTKVEKIDDAAFEGTGLTTTPWGENNDTIKSLGEFVFHNCADLAEAYIPNKIERIGDGLFDGCVSLKNVAFGENTALTSIGDYAFHNCVALGSEGMGIPASTETIGDGAFDGCVSLKNVAFGENAALTSIGNSAFRNCAALCSITVEDFAALNGTNALGYEGLNKITFPEKIKRIGDRAFEGCGGLIGVLCLARGRYYNDMSIGNFAFRDCTGLKSVVISKKSVKIGAGAFRGCGLLSNVYIVDRNKNEADTNKNSEIASIGYRAFYDCGMLSYVGYIKPKGSKSADKDVNLMYLGDEAFHGCESLPEKSRPKCAPYTQYTINQVVWWHGRIGIAGEIERFMRVYDVDEFSRYHAYDHVHEKFSEYIERRKGLSSEESERLFDELRLPHFLHTFLASWGMLRGSSFLLYKDYKFLKRVCEIVCEERFGWLLDVDPFKFGDDVREQKYRQYIHDILELRDEITYCFEDGGSFYKPGSAEIPIDSVTDTLISKILLATLGCIPAYDTYVRSALQGLGVSNDEISGEGLGDLLGFVTGYTENHGGENEGFRFFTREYEKARKERKTYGGPDYSVMKYVDMALWGYGYLIDGKEDDEG